MSNSSRLSILQKWMLARAMDNRRTEGRDANSNGADLYNREVLGGFYEFPYSMYPNFQGSPQQFLRGKGGVASLGLGYQIFDPDRIGRGRYNAAQAAVSRAAKRLQARGFVECVAGSISHWAGIVLTESGIAAIPASAAESQRR